MSTPCGSNASLEEAKAKIDELKNKISGGLGSIGDLGSITDTIKAKLAEVNIAPTPSLNLQAELAKLPYMTPAEYTAAVAKLKSVFGKTVPNLDSIISKIPKPFGLSTSGEQNLFEKLQNLANNITTTTQDIIDSLSPENIANSLLDMCKEVPNQESVYKTDETGAVVVDITGAPILLPPEEKPAAPVTPQSNPVKETPPPTTKRTMSAKWVKDEAFIAKVRDAAKALNCSGVDLLACMAFETGRTFDPGIQNSIGATGLIQFIKPTAIGLGTTTDKLAVMTRSEQMDWVLKYFKATPVSKVKAPVVDDLYMAILWPIAVGKAESYVLFSAPTKAYEQNKGLDRDKKGYVTKADAAAKARSQLPYIKAELLAAGITL
jgi:hypothetical protein